MNVIHDIRTPLGKMVMAGEGQTLTGLWFCGQQYERAGLQDGCTDGWLPVFAQTEKWLDIYFQGKNPGFLPEISFPKGTPFQKMVWEILLSIPYGETMTYGEIAKIVAARRGISRMSAQAVGQAVGYNPIGILVPCHRVVGSDRSLTGYAGGMDKKQKLLELEGIIL